MLFKQKKCLHVLRLLREDGCSQTEIDHLFNNIVLPNITYGLSVYCAADSELTTIQCFLDHCHKHRYISKHVDVRNLMEIQDRKIIKKVSRLSNHPLHRLMPQVKLTKYKLRNKSSKHPKINTSRFMNNSINQVNFKYNVRRGFRSQSHKLDSS